MYSTGRAKGGCRRLIALAGLVAFAGLVAACGQEGAVPSHTAGVELEVASSMSTPTTVLESPEVTIAVPNVVDLLDGVGDLPTSLTPGATLVVESTACVAGIHSLGVVLGEGQRSVHAAFVGAAHTRVATLVVPSEWPAPSAASLEVSCSVAGLTAATTHQVDIVPVGGETNHLSGESEA